MHPQNDQYNFPDLPLIEGDKTIAYNPDQSQLTTWYAERSVKFIEKNKVISRTIQIRGSQSLEILHCAIFDAFGREDEHMYWALVESYRTGKGSSSVGST